MTDGREEPSASYKLGNGWVILHWCANLTIILTGFTFIPARINAQPDGQVFIVCAIVQVAVLVVLGIASQITVMRSLSMENWASPLRTCALFLAGVAWYFAAHAIGAGIGLAIDHDAAAHARAQRHKHAGMAARAHPADALGKAGDGGVVVDVDGLV